MAGISLTVRLLMIVSGLTGLTMFLLANFYLKKRQGWKVATGLVQVAINAFVFASWLNGFLQATPGSLARVVTLIGFTVPTVMASITLVRVILPALRRGTRR